MTESGRYVHVPLVILRELLRGDPDALGMTWVRVMLAAIDAADAVAESAAARPEDE
jgi:hypothetical protein